MAIVFDPDHAGEEAAIKTAGIFLSAGLGVRVAALPEGEDPDSLVRKIGKDAFEQQLEGSQPIAEFLFENLAKGIDLGSFDGRARLSTLCLPLIKQAPEGVFKHLMMQELARLTGLDSQTMDDIARRDEPTAATAPEPTAPPAAEPQSPPTPVERAPQRQMVEKNPVRAALATLLLYPKLATLVPNIDELRGIESIEGQLLLEMLELIKREPDTRTHILVGSWLNTDKHHYATQLLGFEDLLEDENKAKQEFTGAIKRIRRDIERQRLEQEWLELSQLKAMSAQQKARYIEVLTALQANSHYM